MTIAAVRDITRLPWWRVCTVRVLGAVPPPSRALAAFLPRLLASFTAQGHRVLTGGTEDADLILICGEVPDGPHPLRDRVPEQIPPPSVVLRQQHRVNVDKGHVVGLVEVPEALGDWSHADVVTAARTLMSRLGVPKAVFLTRGEPDEIREATVCTLEGGHPTERHDLPDRVRDRLVTGACASEVAGRYEIEPDVLAASAWHASPTPEDLAAAGARMGRLGLLPPPVRFADYVSPQLAAMYEAYFSSKGFSEGMLFAFDPGLDVLVVTATGGDGVDKRHLGRDDVVAVDHRAGPVLQVLAPRGRTPKAPSVEAWEIRALFAAAPTVRVGRSEGGRWMPCETGGREVPIIRSGIHAHVGVDAVDESVVETVELDRDRFPYGFGCGTDLMVEVGRDIARRSQAMNDPRDPRRYVRWHLLYHGEMAVELWKPGIPGTPLTGLLDQYDPTADGSVHFTPDHIHQRV